MVSSSVTAVFQNPFRKQIKLKQFTAFVKTKKAASPKEEPPLIEFLPNYQ